MKRATRMDIKRWFTAELILGFTLLLNSCGSGAGLPPNNPSEVPPGGPSLVRHTCFYYLPYPYPCPGIGTCTGFTPYIGAYLMFEAEGRYFVSFDKSKGEGGTYTWKPETLEVLFLTGPLKDVWAAELGTDNDTVYFQYSEDGLVYECSPDEAA